MVTVRIFESGRTADGLWTVMEAVPVAASRLAGTVALRLLAFPYMVISAVPFHCTTELALKPVPVTAILVAGEPTMNASGVTERRLSVGGALMAMLAVFEVPPPGDALTTVSDRLPLTARSAAVRETVNCVPFI
jgi:hypothetical protein